MISWRFYFVFVVAFHSKSVACSSDNSNVPMFVILFILAVVIKVMIWIGICFCRCRRKQSSRRTGYRRIALDADPPTAVVANSSNVQTNTASGCTRQQQRDNPRQQASNPPQRAQQGRHDCPQKTIPKTGELLVNLANGSSPPNTDSDVVCV